MRNYGKTHAQQIRYYQFTHIQEGPPIPQFKKKNSNLPDTAAPLLPSQTGSSAVVSPPLTLTADRFKALVNTDHGIGISGRIEYTDTYGTKYVTGFCYSRLATGAINYGPPTCNYVK
jgi:hypothetical protein